MECPQISIIVPVYNAENYLNRCVDSILTQTFTDFEIILVNDGSPDNSGAICDEYALKDNRIKVIHKRNGGVSSARNIGIENSIGKWITFIDADDYIEAGFLNIPTEATEDLLIQNYQYFNEKEYVKIFKKKNISNSEFQNFINENIEEIWLRTPWAKFYKSSIIKDNNIKFPLGIKIGEDTLFVQEYLLRAKSVQYVASAKYMYKCDDSKMAKKYELATEDALNIFRKLYINYKKLNAVSNKYLIFIFLFFYMLLKNKRGKLATSWYKDEYVIQTYKIIKFNLGIRFNLKYQLYKLLS